ncbi:MAG TPA: hypothetical protein VE093_30375 [Polyangiaceae bacterium]|jgi:hypothetical protein|nr:hypothetical protein [Polyangiaceae bacterium]
MGGPPPGPPKKSHTTLIILLAAVVGGGLLVISVLGALAYSGMRKYLSSAKSAEARVNVSALAQGIAACAQKPSLSAGDPGQNGLPPSSPRVPASLAQVKGTRYASSPADWSSEAFACALFSIPTPQYFQYQWLLTSPGAQGIARAEGDLDGDGIAEIAFERDITCASSGGSLTCSVGPLREKK